MRTCTEPCSRGFNRCCKDCQIEEFCTVKCSYQVCDHEEPKPRAKKNRIAQKFRTVYILLAMLIALTITASIIIISQLDKIAVLSVDILNTEQLANQEQKDAVGEDLALPRHTETFTITYYCPCEQCCGKSDGITASGTIATEGRTIAVDPDVIPLGTTVTIEGHDYIAEDIGGAIKGLHIDIFTSSHETALQLGKHEAEVTY